MTDESADRELPSGSGFALLFLVALVVVSPWPMGGAPPWASRVLTLAALSASALALVYEIWRGQLMLPPAPYWALYGLVGLGLFQLLPLPPTLHALLAPGSDALWHPAEPAAAAVLGHGWRPISVHPAATRAWVAWVLGLLTLSALALPALRIRRLAMRAVVAVVSAGVLVAVYGIVARVAFGPLLFGRIAVPTVSPFGPFVSKNHFAGYVTMLALLALGLAGGLADAARRTPGALSWVGSPRAGSILVAFGASTALALAVLVSQSRGGVVGLVIGGLAFALLRALVRRHHTARPLLLLIGAVVVAGALLAVIPREARARIASLGATTADTSGAYRLGIWHDTLRVFGSSPLVGQGLGAFEDALPRYKTVAGELRVEHAENDYCELLAEGGALAFALVILALLLALPRVATWLRTQGNRRARGLVLGETAALLALAVHSLFDFNLRLPACASVAVLLGTLLLGSLPAPETTHKGLTRLFAGGLLAAVLFAMAAVGFAGQPQRAVQLADVQALPASRSRAGLRGVLATSALAEHLRHRPADAEGWLFLAWLRPGETASAALARYGASLDPMRRDLQAAAQKVSASTPR